MRAGQQRIGIGADGVEGDVAEVEQAGKADDDVQAERQEDVENGEIDDAHPGLAAQRGDEGQRDQQRGDQERCPRRNAA